MLTLNNEQIETNLDFTSQSNNYYMDLSINNSSNVTSSSNKQPISTCSSINHRVFLNNPSSSENLNSFTEVNLQQLRSDVNNLQKTLIRHEESIREFRSVENYPTVFVRFNFALFLFS